MEQYPDKLPAEFNNPFSLSKQYLLVVTFNKSSSKNFQAALLWARSAELFQTFKVDKEEIFLCAFGKNAEQAGMASVFLGYKIGLASKFILLVAYIQAVFMIYWASWIVTKNH